MNGMRKFTALVELEDEWSLELMTGENGLWIQRMNGYWSIYGRNTGSIISLRVLDRAVRA